MKKIIFLSIIIVCIVFVSLAFLTKKDDPYTPNIKNIDSFIIEDDTRYIILYHSDENHYYLGKVGLYSTLDDHLYYLGDTVCNFKKADNDIIVISNSEQVIYSSGNYNLLPDDVYDVQSLGLLRIRYNAKNHDMQILRRNSEALCKLSFKYYCKFIPVDLIET